MMLMMKMIAKFMYIVWRCLNQIESELHERNMVRTQCVPIKSLSSIRVYNGWRFELVSDTMY